MEPLQRSARPEHFAESARGAVLAVSRHAKAVDDGAPRQLGDQDQLTYDLLSYELNNAMQMESFPDHLLPLNQIDNVPAPWPTTPAAPVPSRWPRSSNTRIT
jgi:uncharacterized protein (DUF885 family)